MDKSTKELLAQAEKLCAQRNVRLTPQRLEVLRLMSLQQGAISAYDLLDLLRESEPRQNRRPFIGRWIFCWSKDLCIKWNQQTAMCCAIFLTSQLTRPPCLSAIAVVW